MIPPADKLVLRPNVIAGGTKSPSECEQPHASLASGLLGSWHWQLRASKRQAAGTRISSPAAFFRNASATVLLVAADRQRPALVRLDRLGPVLSADCAGPLSKYRSP
jgi:hypothetical protein